MTTTGDVTGGEPTLPTLLENTPAPPQIGQLMARAARALRDIEAEVGRNANVIPVATRVKIFALVKGAKLED